MGLFLHLVSCAEPAGSTGTHIIDETALLKAGAPASDAGAAEQRTALNHAVMRCVQPLRALLADPAALLVLTLVLVVIGAGVWRAIVSAHPAGSAGRIAAAARAGW